MLNIARVDGETAISGGLSWSGLQGLGKISYFPRTSSSELLTRVSEAEVILTNQVPFSRELREQMKKLKYIGVTATGYNIVDME